MNPVKPGPGFERIPSPSVTASRREGADRAGNGGRALRGQDVATRWQVRIRSAPSSLEPVETALSRAGAVLEVGCGHGSFRNHAALASPEGTQLGIDNDPRKLAVARRTERASMEFEEGDARKPPPAPISLE